MKNKQIIMLALVFVVSGVCGWFLESAIIGEEYNTADEVADEAAAEVLPELSTIPVVDTTVELKPVSNGTRYSLTANAFVESDDTLSYFLFENKECSGKCYEGKGGKFISIPGKADETYYLVVKNTNTSEFSDIVPVKGFVIRYDKITEAELEELFNRYKSWSKAPAAMTSKMEKSALKNLQVVVVNEDPNEEYTPKSLREICQSVSAGIWKKVDVVGEPSYDDQGRLRKLKIEVLR